MSPAPADYVDVAERIRQFKAEYPNGSLQTGFPELLHVGDKTFVYVQAQAYRTPDDRRPGTGTAWEPVPGPTPFTRDSELMNAETSAWGRAIVALGFETKKIASADEVRNRQAADDGAVLPAPGHEPDPRQVMIGQLAVIHKRLREQAPKAEGQSSWAEVLQGHSYSEFGKTDSADLKEGELRSLVDYANGLLKAEGLPTV